MMQKDASNIQAQRRTYLLIGSCCFFLLMLLAVIFYRERTAFCDTAFQLMYLLVRQQPIVMPVRFGAGLSQLLPLCAVWSHASLRTVMIVHSLSTLVLYLIIFFIAYRFSRRGLLFLLIPIGLCLIANDVFYWTVSDVQVGLVWLSLYAVFLFEENWSGKLCYWPLHFLIILWIQVFHLLLFLPILFLIFYYYDTKSALFSKKFLIHLLLCVAAFLIRYRAAQHHWYERQKIGVWHNLQINLPHLLSLDTTQMLFRNFAVYSIYFLCLGMAIVWLVYMRRYMRALFVAAISFGHWLLVVVTDPSDSGFYVENMLLPLGFIAALPLVAEIIPMYRSRWIALMISVLMLVRIGFIYDAHHKYTARFESYKPYIRYARAQKLNGVFVDASLTDRKTYFMAWGSGYESMLLSAVDSPDSCVIVQFNDDLTHFTPVLHSDSIPIMPLEVWGHLTLPPQYFKLPGRDYQIIKEKLKAE